MISRSWPARRRVVISAGLVAVAGVVFGGSYLGIHKLVVSTPVLPGLAGCRYLEDRSELVRCISRRATIDLEQPIASVARLDALLEGPRLQDGCHQAGHVLARRFVKRYNDWAERTYDGLDRMPQSRQCTFGFLHGLLEQAVILEPGTSDRLGREVCELVRGQPRNECYHGIGHGLIRSDESVPLARSRCARLPEPIHCMSGVHMQRAFTFRPRVKEAELCEQIPEREVISCFLYTPMVAERTRTLNGIADTVDFCNREIPDEPVKALVGCSLAVAFTIEPDEVEICRKLRRADVRRMCAHTVSLGPSGGLDRRED